MGLVSGLSLANYSDSESFLVVHALFSQDGFWEVVKDREAWSAAVHGAAKSRHDRVTEQQQS